MIECPHCKKGELELIDADEPWHPEHYMCSECCSTYSIWDIEDNEEE